MRANLQVRLSPRLSYLTPDQMDIIHKASLEVMETAGIQVNHPEALELLRGAGA